MLHHGLPVELVFFLREPHGLLEPWSAADGTSDRRGWCTGCGREP